METGKNAIAFARANNSNLLRSLKHLLKTRLYQYAYECSILTTTYRVIVNPTMHLVNPIMHLYFLHNVNCIQLCQIFFLNLRYSLVLSPFILVHYTSVKRI